MSEKTEEATEHRKKKATDDGDGAFSQEAMRLVFIAAGLGLTHLVVAEFLMPAFTGLLGRALHSAAQAGPPGPVVREFVLIVAGLAITAFAVGLVACGAGAAVQGAFRVSLAKLKVQASNLDPIAGAKKLFSVRNLIQLLLGIVKIVVIACLAYASFNAMIRQPHATASWAAPWRAIESFMLTCLAAAVPFAVGDVFLQRYQFAKRIRMSHEDIKNEHKEMQGSPEAKSEQKRFANELSNDAPPSKARRATFVVANPTHIAAAVRYEAQNDSLPQVLVMGSGDRAIAIMAEARAAMIPIIADRPLARGLYANARENEAVPKDYLEPVAQIIVALMQEKEGAKHD